MEVKTNILLSVIVGGYPIIEKPEDYQAWEKEYVEFRNVLPFVYKKGASSVVIQELNTKARSEAIYTNCPEMSRIEGYLTCAKSVISKYYKDHSSLDKNYYDYCKELIKLAEETTGTFHYFGQNEAE